MWSRVEKDGEVCKRVDIVSWTCLEVVYRKVEMGGGVEMGSDLR